MLALLLASSLCLVVVAAVLVIWTRAGDAGDAGDASGSGDAGGSGGSGVTRGSTTGRLIATLAAGETAVDLGSKTIAGGAKAGMKSWRLPAAARQACVVSFDVLFEPGFYHACQGKVGGVSIGPGHSSGCRHAENGASHRLMWRRGAGAISYVYVPPSTYGSQPGPLRKGNRCGQSLWDSDFAGSLATGAWHRVEIGTKLNTPGRGDGKLSMAIDGKVRALDGVRWRTSGDHVIDTFAFNFFFGGGCTGKTSRLRWRNLAVHEFAG